MKRFMLLAFGLIFVVLCASAFAADTSAPVPIKIEPGKEAPAKIITSRTVRMRATGKVTEISDTMIKIDRTVKENAELMEFALEKPVSAINVGDRVNVSYITKNGGNVAVRVYPVKKYTIKLQKVTNTKEVKKTPEKASPAKEAPTLNK